MSTSGSWWSCPLTSPTWVVELHWLVDLPPEALLHACATGYVQVIDEMVPKVAQACQAVAQNGEALFPSDDFADPYTRRRFGQPCPCAGGGHCNALAVPRGPLGPRATDRYSATSPG
ncbi:MAG TPA: hypothetical protein VFN61_16375 [Acidimicrobiales bacterium]|nr:hypothetical protein [Acidimicrobiales bacterium]